MRARSYDAVIVGAGPAGATTALLLARAGRSVALVERRPFPRFKPCGEFMSPEVLPLLRELGVYDEIRVAGAREVRGMLLVHGGRRVLGRFVDVGRSVAPFDHGWAIRREVFDDVLLRAAVRAGDVELYSGYAVERLLRDERGAIDGVVAVGAGGALALLGQFTVGADGAHSRVAAELGVQQPTRWLDKLALTTRYASVPWSDCAEVHIFDHGGGARGFFAAAPVDGGLLSVNLVLERAAFARERLQRDRAFDSWLSRTPALAERLRCGTRVDPVRGTASFATRTTAQTFDGAALVGDASGYVDPITGEGIFFAIQGGFALAGALSASLTARRRDRAALLPYLKARRREIEPRATLGTWLQRGLRHPRLVRGAFALLQARPQLADLLVSVTGDYVPLGELARPAVWRKALAGAGHYA